MKKIITIDGLSSSGKSTISCHLARELGWNWVSTGVIYRGIAYIGNKNKFKKEDYEKFIVSKDWKVKLSSEKTLFFYKKEEITSKLHSPQVDEWASLLSADEGLRKKLISFQREFSVNHPKGLIAEGRDCGTIIFKEAPIKIFLKANKETRATRRYLDRNQSKDQTLKLQKERDRRDETRSFAPAIEPDGSLVIDTEAQNVEAIVKYICGEACKKGLNKA